MDRAQRRYESAKAKARAKSKLLFWQIADLKPPTPRQIGKAAAMHNTCPCWMCTTKEPNNRYKGGYMEIDYENPN